MKVKFEPGPAACCWLALWPMRNAPVSGPGPLLLRPLACLNIAVGLGSLLSLVSVHHTTDTWCSKCDACQQEGDGRSPAPAAGLVWD